MSLASYRTAPPCDQLSLLYTVVATFTRAGALAYRVGRKTPDAEYDSPPSRSCSGSPLERNRDRRAPRNNSRRLPFQFRLRLEPTGRGPRSVSYAALEDFVCHQCRRADVSLLHQASTWPPDVRLRGSPAWRGRLSGIARVTGIMSCYACRDRIEAVDSSKGTRARHRSSRHDEVCGGEGG
jgi:hypothetical protein